MLALDYGLFSSIDSGLKKVFIPFCLGDLNARFAESRCLRVY